MAMFRASLQRAALFLSAAYLAPGCLGAVEDLPIAQTTPTPVVGPPPAPPRGEPPPAPPASCTTFDPGPSLIRRLNRTEYDNTVRDLLGDTSRPARAFPPEEKPSGFDNDAASLSASPLLLEGHLEAAERLAAAFAEGDLTKRHGCDPVRQEECARQLITTLARRAFRGPVDPEEQDALFQLHRTASEARAGLRQAVTAILLSPRFLYRVELGEAGIAGATSVPLTRWELASRLSYFLWKTMPDERLMTAAESGALASRQGLRAEVERMLADPRARAMLGDFHAQWLELERLDGVTKDARLFPEFSAVAPLMREETAKLVEHVLWTDAGDLRTLLTAPYTMANARLATFYGLSRAPADAQFTRTADDDRRHAGVLTQGGIMAMLSASNHTDPVLRGKFVRENLLCQILPSPPEGVEIQLPEAAPDQTTRERFKMHSQNPSCAGCHQLMDPVGLGFEHHDAAGVWRANELGRPVDASGDVVGVPGLGRFEGAPALGRQLAQSPAVRACVVKMWFRYAFGRLEETAVDTCTLEALAAKFADSAYRVRDLVVAITETDAFRLRRVRTDGGAL